MHKVGDLVYSEALGDGLGIITKIYSPEEINDSYKDFIYEVMFIEDGNRDRYREDTINNWKRKLEYITNAQDR